MKKNILFLFIAFNFLATAQQINYASPSTSFRGQTMDITVIGTRTQFTKVNKYLIYFQSYNSTGSYSDIIVNSVMAINNLRLVINITIDQKASTGFYRLCIDDSSWVFPYLIKDSAFQVNIPSLTTVSPSNGMRGETLDINITGLNTHFKFGSNLSVSFLQGNIPLLVNSVIATSNTSLIANITINSIKNLGFYRVTVFDPMSGSINIDSAFQVKPSAFLLSAKPNRISEAQTTNIKITGTKTNFTLGLNSVTFFYHDSATSAIQVNSYNAANDSTINCNITFKSSVINGNYDIHISDYIDGNLILHNALALAIATGIDQVQKNNASVSMYPNPANEVINISFAPQPVEVTIAVYEMTGRLLKSVTTNKNSTSLDVSDLKNGIYFVTLSGKELNTSRKIIINK